jgi:hypothetical protein
MDEKTWKFVITSHLPVSFRNSTAATLSRAVLIVSLCQFPTRRQFNGVATDKPNGVSFVLLG